MSRRVARLDVLALISLALVTVTTGPGLAQMPGWIIRNVEGQYLDVLTADQVPRLRYVYQRSTADQQAEFDTAKVFLHVFAPDGKTTLTQGIDGELYPHHRGIFVGWSRLEHEGQQHNLWGATNMAQLHRHFRVASASPQEVVISSVIEWLGSGGKKVLEEERTHCLVSAPDAYVLLDVNTVLTAAHGAVTLGGDPEHAGLHFRPHGQVAVNKSARYLFPRPDTDPRTDLDLPWVAETFVVHDQTWTVQMMNHPQNPRGARWSAYRDYGRFGPFNTIQLPAGKSCTLRYRFHITAGEAPSREQLQSQYDRYAQTP